MAEEELAEAAVGLAEVDSVVAAAASLAAVVELAVASEAEAAVASAAVAALEVVAVVEDSVAEEEGHKLRQLLLRLYLSLYFPLAGHLCFAIPLSIV